MDQLVPGDIVKVKNGDKVPADLVLLLCQGLKAECSSLTGEWEPISCTDKVSVEGIPYFECKNVAFNGSLCFDGMMIGLVFCTGNHMGTGTKSPSTAHKWQLIITKSVKGVPEDENEDVEYKVLMKGAPKVILKCYSMFASSKAGQADHFQEPIIDEF